MKNLLWLLCLVAGCSSTPPNAPTPALSQAKLTITGERCSIYVDDVLKGAPPIELTTYPNQIYRIRAQGFDGTKQEKSVVGDGKDAKLDFAFKKPTGVVLVPAEMRGEAVAVGLPQNLMVKIDGKIRKPSRREANRLTYATTEGKHVVEVSGMGMKPVRREFVDHTGIQLTLPRGVVKVLGPKNAEVLVGGVSQGVAPLTIAQVPIGLEEIEVQVPGCKARRLFATVRAGQTTSVTAPGAPDVWTSVGQGLTYEQKSLARPEKGVVVAWVRGPLVIKDNGEKVDECLVRIDKRDNSYQRIDVEGFEIQPIEKGSVWQHLAESL